MNNLTEIIINTLYNIPCMIPALVFHEFAHGWTAGKLGDPTAKNEGRLTLNPSRHLDIIGTISLLILGFGWAKPTPVNPSNFKKRKTGMVLVSLAGPVSNLILAIISIFAYDAIYFACMKNPEFFNNGSIQAIIKIFFGGIQININLFLFNMLPIPPLDGSQILSTFSSKIRNFFSSHAEGISSIFLILLLMFNVLDFYLIICGNYLYNFLQFIPSHIFGLV